MSHGRSASNRFSKSVVTAAMLMTTSVFAGTPLRVMPLGDSITQGMPLAGG
jgi:hypothetical protein